MKHINYICGGTNYAYGKEYIVLPIQVENLPESVLVGGFLLQKKSSFHVSLLCVRALLTTHPEWEQEIFDSFCSFTKEHDISFIKYTGEFRFTQKDERKTLIAMCEVSNLTKVSEFLGKELGIDIPALPTHVTLYALQPDAGIGLNSISELEAYSRPIQAPEGIVLL